MIEIACANRDLLGYLLAHLRAGDRAELAACDADLERMPDEIMARAVFAFCACDVVGSWCRPIAAWGMLQQARSGVGAGFAFGTDEWGDALLPMVRQIRRFVLPHLREAGFHRVEALALAHRHDVARFMALIDAQPEATLRGYGCGGEDFTSYRWLADEYRGERHAVGALHAHTAH
jgi:hypothetical protein